MRTCWTYQEIEELRMWHEARMIELFYPEAIVEELRGARERWLMGVRRFGILTGKIDDQSI